MFSHVSLPDLYLDLTFVFTWPWSLLGLGLKLARTWWEQLAYYSRRVCLSNQYVLLFIYVTTIVLSSYNNDSSTRRMLSGVIIIIHNLMFCHCVIGVFELYNKTFTPYPELPAKVIDIFIEEHQSTIKLNPTRLSLSVQELNLNIFLSYLLS